MWIKTKDNQLINLDNIVRIFIDKAFSGDSYIIKAWDISEDKAYNLAMTDIEDEAKDIIEYIGDNIAKDTKYLKLNY